MTGEEGGKFHPFDVQPAHIAYAVLGGFVVLFGMFSLLIREKLYIGEAPIATVFGIIIGPYVIGLFDPRSWGGMNASTSNAITLEVTRVVLAVGVFAIGVELPKQYMLHHWKSLLYLLGPLMTYGWFVSAAFIYALIPGLSFLSALVIAACLTPTDPILAAAVVGGKYANKHVPAHLRQLLTAESGCNDGAAFPFLYIALYLTLQESDSHAVGEWFYVTWLYEVALGTVFGAFLGFGFRHLMKFCERKNLIDRHSYVAQYISLAMLAIGATTLLGSDDLLAAFACGTAFAWDGWFNRQTEESQFSNVIDLLFNCACFIYIGAWIPFSDFNSDHLHLSPWRLIVMAILVLALRRLPAVIALYRLIPDIKTFREALFSGHFGPMGVGAVFISTLACTKLPEIESPPTSQVQLLAQTIQPVVAFMVLCSIAIHGLSIPFFSLGRRVHSITFTYTYSRRQSMDPAAPEWATQVRRMPSRREDIVINRDNLDEKDLEKGLPGSESGTQTAHASGSGESGTPTPANEPTALLGEDIADAKTLDDNEDGRQWREGRDLVVETQADPTEEVHVKVIKGAFADDDGNIAGDMIGKVKGEVQTFKNEVQQGELGAGPSMRMVDMLARPLASAESSTRSPRSGARPSTAETLDSTTRSGGRPLGRTSTADTGDSAASPRSRQSTAENDAEWNDEPLDTPTSPSSPTVMFEEPGVKERSRSPKKRKHILAAATGGGSRRGRRRDSVRRALFSTGRPKTAPAGTRSPGDSGDEGGGAGSSVESSPAGSVVDLPGIGEERGRNTDTAGGGVPPSRRSSMRPANRSRVPSRTSSPAPSRIRFADDGSAPTSPTTGAPGGIIRSPSGLIHSSTPHEGVYYGHGHPSPTATQQQQSDSNRVMFDLPAKPDRS